MSRLMRIIGQNCAQHEVCLGLFADWEKDAGITSGVLPLCLCAAMHALALERIKHGLVEVYPPNTASDESLWNAVVGAFQQHEQFIRVWLKSTPQTSEVRRAAPILAGLNYCLSRYPMPVMLSEFGANAGFNLLLDRCSLNAGRTLQPADDPIVTLSPDWMGVIPAQQPLKIIDRAGVDINPLNPVDRLDYSRLLSYTWADQCARLDHIKQIAPHQTIMVEQTDAVDWLPNRLSKQRIGTLHFVFHTIALQYFPQESKDKIAHALSQAGKRATPERPLGYI